MALNSCSWVSLWEMQVCYFLILLVKISQFIGDIWLSLLYRPPVTVSDTACTLSANLINCGLKFSYVWFLSFLLVLREPQKTRDLWFQDRLGGFEVPVPDQAPHKISIPELKVAAIFKDSLLTKCDSILIRKWFISRILSLWQKRSILGQETLGNIL